MTASFLESLVGLDLATAERIVCDAGYGTLPYPDGSPIPSIAITKTVILWVDGDKVVSVSPGDPCELELGDQQ